MNINNTKISYLIKEECVFIEITCGIFGVIK